MTETITITDLKKYKLDSFTNILTNAVKNSIPVNINTNVRDAEEIIKGTFLAETLSRHGFKCIATIQKDEMIWDCIKIDKKDIIS